MKIEETDNSARFLLIADLNRFASRSADVPIVLRDRSSHSPRSPRSRWKEALVLVSQNPQAAKIG